MPSFDPYHKWLAIPPKDQPPNHYRLLGIENFETDPEVIDAGANRQMDYLRQCGIGPHAALSQKLLNEVASARLCLLNPRTREAYDNGLKDQLAARKAAARPSQAPLEADRGTPFSTLLAVGGGALLCVTVLWVLLRPASKPNAPGRVVQSSAPAESGGSDPPASGSAAESQAGQTAARGAIESSDASPTERTEPEEKVAAAAQADKRPGDPQVARVASVPPDEPAPPAPPAPPTRPAQAFSSPPPATPAAESLRKPVDLLRLVNAGRDSVRGDWRSPGTVLFASSDSEQAGSLQIPYLPPEEYELTLEIEPKGKSTVMFGLIFGGRPCIAVLDLEQDGQPFASVLGNIDGRNIVDRRNPSRQEGRFLTPDRPNTVKATVSSGRILVEAGNATAIDWSGDPSQVSLPPFVAVPNEEALFLCVPSRSSARITGVQLVPRSGTGTVVTRFPKRPRNAPRDAIPWRDNWYWFSSTPYSQAEAKAFASQHRGTLLVISSEEENEFVARHITGPTVLGMDKDKRSNQWINAYGAVQQYTNWDRGQPSNGNNERFVVIHLSGRWHDHNPERLRFALKWGKE